MLNYQRVNLRFPMVFLWFTRGYQPSNQPKRSPYFFSRGCLSKSKKWSVSNFRFVFDDVEEPFESCFRNHFTSFTKKKTCWDMGVVYITQRTIFVAPCFPIFKQTHIYIYIFPFLFMTKSDIQWLGHERMTRPFLKVC